MQLGGQLLQDGGALTAAQQRQQLPGAPALPGLPLPLQKVLQQKLRQEVELPHLVKGLGRPAAAAGQQQGGHPGLQLLVPGAPRVVPADGEPELGQPGGAAQGEIVQGQVGQQAAGLQAGLGLLAEVEEEHLPLPQGDGLVLQPQAAGALGHI